MIFTSYYGNINKIRRENPKLKIIGISRYTWKEMYLDGQLICLAPRLVDLWNYKNNEIDWKKYSLNYFNKLYDLPWVFLRDFEENFDNCVLCCYEREDYHCHRKLFRKFMKWWNGLEIVEY